MLIFISLSFRFPVFRQFVWRNGLPKKKKTKKKVNHISESPKFQISKKKTHLWQFRKPLWKTGYENMIFCLKFSWLVCNLNEIKINKQFKSLLNQLYNDKYYQVKTIYRNCFLTTHIICKILLLKSLLFQLSYVLSV